MIWTIVEEDGLRKFLKLTSLMNCVLILAHGNVDPERGLQSKHLLNVHGSTTIEALRFVKDCLNRKDQFESVKFS